MVKTLEHDTLDLLEFVMPEGADNKGDLQRQHVCKTRSACGRPCTTAI